MRLRYILVLRSNRVGSMELYNAKGEQVPGFGGVVFASSATAKLASVGELCDAGMICVFDNTQLRTFKASEVQITGTAFTQDSRDQETRLYPLQLFRKQEPEAAAVAMWAELPEVIPDRAFLAKTYVREDLSELDRYHAKLGDVGIKAMKRALPQLKIPTKYRCEACIEGKIHKFGHKKCKSGDRTQYLPGVCIHSDHSGPYARSIGGYRYSQLFMDRGSGFLWAVRMTKKTGHYDAFPRVIADARAASGRKLQFFQTDGDGVFASCQTSDLLLAEKVRHLRSAAHDSNTNPFIERARRTVFEGTCTSLLRSGAPACFWGEAEAHKIFTMNVLPSFEDPERKGVFLSRKNLLEGDQRAFNLEHLMAFGTAATCYIPTGNRQGGKVPSQRRSFRGVIVGYAENMPSYRVWDLAAKKLRYVSYNFTIAHEGFYPFKDKNIWEREWQFQPANFFTTATMTERELESFDFDREELEEVQNHHSATELQELPRPAPSWTVLEIQREMSAPLAQAEVPVELPRPELKISGVETVSSYSVQKFLFNRHPKFKLLQPHLRENMQKMTRLKQKMKQRRRMRSRLKILRKNCGTLFASELLGLMRQRRCFFEP